MDMNPVPAKQTLLMTGGSGFFGKSVLDAFGRGLLAPFGIARIIALSRQAQALRALAPQLCGPGVELVDGDVQELDSTFGAHLVIHAAASSDARHYQTDPAHEMRTIVQGTQRVCDAVAQASNRPRLLYVSSGAVYGRQPPDVAALAEDAPFVVDADPFKEAYTQAKRQAETIVSRLALEHRVPTRIARCFAFVGPWLPRDQHFAMGNFLGAALRGAPIEVRARHPVLRSYLHADDLAVWLLRLASAEGGCGEAYNVGSGQAVSLRDLATLMAGIAGLRAVLPETDSTDLPDDRYVPDVGLAKREFGLTVTVPLRTAVERTLHALASSLSLPNRGKACEPMRASQ